MSCPDQKTAMQLVERCATLLREWDDCPFIICVQHDTGGWSTDGRLSDDHRIEIASNLLLDSMGSTINNDST